MSGILPGQRGPDFLLPNPDGELGRFYDRFTGNLVVLFFYPSKADPVAAEELQGFIETATAFQAAGVKIVAITRDSVAAIAALRAEQGMDFTLFSDPEGAITRGYGAGCSTYLLDRNQRVLAHLPSGEGQAAWALSYLETSVPAQRPASLVTGQAPVLLLPNVADSDFRTRVIESWRADHEEGAVRLRSGGAGGGQTKVVDYRLKKRLDHRPDQALNQDLTNVIISRVGPEIFKAFQFRAVALEHFCIAAYEAGRADYFKPHRDNTTKQTEKRRFALTLNLNDDYEGGGLKFPEFGEETYKTEAGGAVVFSCSLLHEALPVTKGTRFAALTFIFGPGDVPPPGARPGARRPG